MVLITIVNGVYKPTYNWGGPHCSYVVIICDYNILQTIAGYAGWSCKPSYNWGCKWCNWLLFFLPWSLRSRTWRYDFWAMCQSDRWHYIIWAHDIFHVHEVIIHVPYWWVFATWFSSLLPKDVMTRLVTFVFSVETQPPSRWELSVYRSES